MAAKWINFPLKWIRRDAVEVSVEDWNEIGPTPKWIPFKNSWVNGSSPPTANTCAFYKDPFGIVHLKGFISAGTSTTAIMFTLPVGYRPVAAMNIATSASPGVHCNITISSTGDVANVGSTPAGATTWTSLENISFRTSADG